LLNRLRDGGRRFTALGIKKLCRNHRSSSSYRHERREGALNLLQRGAQSIAQVTARAHSDSLSIIFSTACAAATASGLPA
jgi:hypothetical protein